MSSYGVIADDLTGANATGVLLTKRGLPAATLFSAGPVDPGLAALLWSTASRALPADVAYNRVATAARALAGIGVRNWAKRIDSTVRGNLGPEVDALLDFLGSDAIAVVTPAFPASGRVVAGGYLLVNGIPVSETAAARDVATPVHESHLPTLLQAQTKRKVAHLPLSTILCGPAAVKAETMRLYAEGARVFAADTSTDEHLETLAAGLELTGLTYFPADPGPFTAAVFAKRAGLAAKSSSVASDAAAKAPATTDAAGRKPMILVSGSVTPVTFVQLGVVRNKLNTVELAIPAVGPADLPALACELAGRATAATDVLLVTTATSAADVVSGLDADSLTAVAGRLGALTKELLSLGEFEGLMTTGGDVTAAVCAALGAHGIALSHEVLPLAARGSLIGGRWAGLPIATKGGLVGDSTALYQCCLSVTEAKRT